MANPIPAPGALPPPTQPWTAPIADAPAPSTYYTGGNPWSTGYSGTGRAVGGSGGGMGGSYGLMPGSPGFQATQAAYNAQNQAFDLGQQRLASGQFLGGAMGGSLGNQAMTRYLNTPGFSEQALAAQRAMLGQMAAGSMANNLRTIQERAQASGFGDSMGSIDAQSRARAQSASDLQNALNALMMENERARMQREATSAGLLGSLAGAEADFGKAAAMAQFNRQFPVIPGITGGGQQSAYTSPYGIAGGVQPTGGYWTQGGKYMAGQQVPYDPFRPQMPQTAGYTPQAPWKPW